MSRSSFKPESFSLGTTYNERTTRFVGVDLTTPQVEVSLKRGVYSNNYVVAQNGKVQTRFGYADVLCRENDIYGIWDFVDSTGVSRTVAVRYVYSSGVYGLSVDEYSFDGVFLEKGDNLYSLNSALSEKPSGTWACQSAHKLWIATGIKFLVAYYDAVDEKLVVEEVAGENAYVPTVTYLGIAANAETIPGTTFVTWQYPNLLSPYRKDLFLGGLNENEAPKFELQTKCDWLSYDDISVRIEYIDDQDQEAVLNLVPVEIKEVEVSTPVIHYEHHVVASGGDTVLLFDKSLNYDVGDELTDVQYNAFAGQLYKSVPGHFFMYLKQDYKPVIGGKPNIEVTYRYVSNAGFSAQTDFVNKATFGTLFGKNNSLNRLWLAGNENKPNFAIHTQNSYGGLQGQSINDEPDFSYFADEGMIRFGEPESSIIAMNVVSEDRMLVLKNKAGIGRTVFYVTPYEVERTVARAFQLSDGSYTSNVIVTEEEYSTLMSNTASAGWSRNASCTFSGDPLFLSADKHVVGLNVEGITGNAKYVTASRSRFIDGKLVEIDLSDAFLFCGGEYLFLSTKDSLFVSNVSSFGTDEEAPRQYEWWPCDALRSDMRFVYHSVNGDMLWLLSDGSVIQPSFRKKDEYYATDAERIGVYEGQGAVVINNGDLVFSDAVASKIPLYDDGAVLDDTFAFYYPPDSQQSSLYSEVSGVDHNYTDRSTIHCVSFGGNLVYFAMPELVGSFADGQALLAAHNSDPLIDVIFRDKTDYYASSSLPLEYGFEYIYFQLEGTNLEVTALYETVQSGKDYVFRQAKVVGEAFTRVSLYRLSGTMMKRLSVSKKTGADFVAYLQRDNAITPEFRSLRLTKGKLGYDKIIDNLVVYNDSETPCELYVGVLTNSQLHMHGANSVRDPGIGFDFNSTNFDKFDMGKNAVPKLYNIKRFPRFQQCFTICFTAKTKRNSVLSGVDILYRVKRASRKR